MTIKRKSQNSQNLMMKATLKSPEKKDRDIQNQRCLI